MNLQEQNAEFKARRARIDRGRPRPILLAKSIAAASPSPSAPIPVEDIRVVEKRTAESIARFKAERSTLPPLPPAPTKLIITVSAEHFGFSYEELVGPRRFAKLAFARQVTAYMLHSITGRSLPIIGQHLNRDHTTILHAIRKVAGLRSSSQGVEATVDAIALKIDRRVAIRAGFFSDIADTKRAA